MVSKGMRRYRHRSTAHRRLIDEAVEGNIDFQQCFGRVAPVRLEIGFGHGEFISQMAASHPEEDFLGVEIQDIRVTKTAHKSLKLDAHNIKLYHAEAHNFVRNRIPQASLKRAYILFSDPWPKPKHRRRRLMNRSFLLDLIYTLEPDGELIIATDTLNYCFQVLSNLSTIPSVIENCYAPQGYRINIPTKFPTVFEIHKKKEGWDIGYLRFRRTDAELPPRLPWNPAGRKRQEQAQ